MRLFNCSHFFRVTRLPSADHDVHRAIALARFPTRQITLTAEPQLLHLKYCSARGYKLFHVEHFERGANNPLIAIRQRLYFGGELAAR